MSQMFLRIALVPLVAVAFQMTSWGGGNVSINRLPSPVIAVAFQENVPINRLPGPVTAAVKNKLPGGEILRAEMDSENGKVKYELKVKSKGQIYEVYVAPDGKVLKIELEHD
jgi:hypothetical protein